MPYSTFSLQPQIKPILSFSRAIPLLAKCLYNINASMMNISTMILSTLKNKKFRTDARNFFADYPKKVLNWRRGPCGPRQHPSIVPLFVFGYAGDADDNFTMSISFD
jgi:hypothetical protein